MIGKDLPALSIAELQLLLRRREVSPREVVNALRERIESVDGEIGAYLSLDLDAAMRDPAQPTHLAPVADGGDHLHPNEAGYRMMAAAIDLALFRGTR